MGLLGAAALLGKSAPAEAATTGSSAPPLLALNLERCAAVAAVDVQGMVGLELHRPVVLLDETAAPAIARSVTTAVRVTCQGLRAEIEIDDPLTGKTIGRVVDLAAAAPVARQHLLALSIVELLAASWIELQSNPHPASPPVGAVTTPEAREAALEVVRDRPGARRAARVLAELGVQTFASGPRSLGGAVIVAGTATRHLGWMADISFQRGERDFALGRVTLDIGSALGALLVGASWGRAALRGGLGARAGEAWLSGAPAESTSAVGGVVRGRWWGPVALLDGSLTLRGRIVFEITLEAGRVLLPVVATVQGADPVAVDGNWIRGGVGAGFTF